MPSLETNTSIKQLVCTIQKHASNILESLSCHLTGKKLFFPVILYLGNPSFTKLDSLDKSMLYILEELQEAMRMQVGNSSFST